MALRITLIIFSLTLFGCQQKKIDDLDYYQVLNQLIKADNKSEVILVNEPIKFYKQSVGLFEWKKDKKMEPLMTMVPANSLNYYGVLVGWTYRDLLDSLEAECIYKNQNSDLDLILDNKKVKLRTASTKEVREIWKNKDKPNLTIYCTSSKQSGLLRPTFNVGFGLILM